MSPLKPVELSYNLIDLVLGDKQMQRVIRRRVVAASKGWIQARATALRKGTIAEALVLVDSEPNDTKHKPIELRESIAAYAAKHRGTESDLDLAVEGAAIEFLGR